MTGDGNRRPKSLIIKGGWYPQSNSLTTKKILFEKSNLAKIQFQKIMTHYNFMYELHCNKLKYGWRLTSSGQEVAFL